MTVVGIETLTYCVDDVERCTDFFVDYGLKIHEQRPGYTRFRLPDASHVELRSLSEAPIPGSQVEGNGVHEVVWGVEDEEGLERLVASLEVDLEVHRDADGTAHFIAEGGIPMALRVWKHRRSVVTAVDPLNSPGNINRLNQHRRWIARAVPKRIAHVVFSVQDFHSCVEFVEERLDFRLSDRQRTLGAYLRAPGSNDHHSIFFISCEAAGPKFAGSIRTRFHHANFLVNDIDEIMVGKNYMERRGWARSVWGVGRHRIASALFLYLPSPAGGEAEYGADSDAIDDNWVPRDWNEMFGYACWMNDMPEFWAQGADWDVGFASPAPMRGAIEPHAYNCSEGPVAEGKHPDPEKTLRDITTPRNEDDNNIEDHDEVARK